MVSLILLCLLVSAGRAAPVDKGSKFDGKDLKKAESVVSKLRRLEESSSDARIFERAARKLYPGLFSKVSALRDGGLKIELATAAALYESSLRATRQSGDGAPDCSRELRESYARLCLEASDRAGLLRAKARLHARRAEAELLYARGDRSAATLDAVSHLRAERGTDRALAAEALHSLKELLAETNDGGQPVGDGARAGSLEAFDRVLASLPRGREYQLLRDARDAFRDALYWRLKAAPALSLVVNADSFTPRGELPTLNLRADDATRAAWANLRTALRLVGRAEEELVTMKSER
jgi:hypothetical protein